MKGQLWWLSSFSENGVNMERRTQLSGDLDGQQCILTNLQSMYPPSCKTAFVDFPVMERHHGRN